MEISGIALASRAQKSRSTVNTSVSQMKDKSVSFIPIKSETDSLFRAGILVASI